jgi:manganese efflux pump family protein
MTHPVVLVGLMLALDSFAVSLAIGAGPRAGVPRRWLVLSFAMCDGLAFWLGACWLGGLRSLVEGWDWLGPAAVAGYGLYVLALAWRLRHLSTGAGPRWYWLTLGLPLCLSLDNLVAGADSQWTGLPLALAAGILGTLSGGLALLGLMLGAAFQRRSPAAAPWVRGALLLLIAVALFVLESLS